MDPSHPTQTSEQLGLFDTARVLPRWESLPAGIRQEVVQLLERILVDYGCRTLEGRTAKREAANE